MPDANESLDVLGIKPVAKSIEIVTQGAIDGAAAFLSRICLPAAEEFGLLFRDRVSAWRTSHATTIANRAHEIVQTQPNPENLQAHPRIVAGVIELGSWSEAEEVREMWAGLLASACTEDGRDDSNLMFIDLLARLSLSQARLLEFTCSNCPKFVTTAGWIMAQEDFTLSLEQLQEVAGITDFHRLDRELDHLRALGLFHDDSGFAPNGTTARVAPSPLALQMYVRCHGSPDDPITFFGLSQRLPASNLKAQPSKPR